MDLNDKLPPASATVDNDRLSYMATVIYETTGEQPLSKECRFSELLECRGEPYERRRVIIDEDEYPIDKGWVTKVKAVWIQNRIGTVRATQPSAEQLADEAKRILVVDNQEIRPGMGQLFFPHDFEQMSIRSLHKEVEATIVVFQQ